MQQARGDDERIHRVLPFLGDTVRYLRHRRWTLLQSEGAKRLAQDAHITLWDKDTDGITLCAHSFLQRSSCVAYR